MKKLPIKIIYFFLILSFQFSYAIESEDNKNKAIEKVDKVDNRAVDLDTLIARNSTQKKGEKFIFFPRALCFSAVIQQLPKKANAEYLLNALAMMGVEPLPLVRHQMFIRSKQGKVIAVYVNDKLTKIINESFMPEQTINWLALHSYNYNRGPALLLVGFQHDACLNKGAE